ncbi:19394_t:CDS:1, partial [Racocetra persica]
NLAVSTSCLVVVIGVVILYSLISDGFSDSIGLSVGFATIILVGRGRVNEYFGLISARNRLASVVSIIG